MIFVMKRRNQDDFDEVWSQLQAQGKPVGKPPSLVPIYAGTFANGSDSGSSGKGPARDGCASRAAQFHPDGGQFDFARSSARTPHVGPQYV